MVVHLLLGYLIHFQCLPEPFNSYPHLVNYVMCRPKPGCFFDLSKICSFRYVALRSRALQRKDWQYNATFLNQKAFFAKLFRNYFNWVFFPSSLFQLCVKIQPYSRSQISSRESVIHQLWSNNIIHTKNLIYRRPQHSPTWWSQRSKIWWATVFSLGISRESVSAIRFFEKWKQNSSKTFAAIFRQINPSIRLQRIQCPWIKHF